MKKNLVLITLSIVFYSCSKKDTATAPTSTTPTITASSLNKFVIDYNDGNADSVFTDSIGKLNSITFKGMYSSVRCSFNYFTGGYCLTRRSNGVLQNYDSVFYTGSFISLFKEYNDLNNLVTTVSVTNNSNGLPTAISANAYTYIGQKLTHVSYTGGYTTDYYYSSSAVNPLYKGTLSIIRDVYTNGAIVTYKQVTDALFYSNVLPDSMVYIHGTTSDNWKLTYDTTSTGKLQDVYVNGVKKYSFTY
jgi:hypothetical protein